MKYGERLRLAREHIGFKQDDLVRVSGVKQGTISKIERGDQHSSSFDAELSYALNVHAMWLKTGAKKFAPDWLNGSATEQIKESINTYTHEPCQNRIISINWAPIIEEDTWKSLSPQIRAFVEDILNKFIGGQLTLEHIKILHNMADALSKP